MNIIEKTCCFTGHRKIEVSEKEMIKKLRPIVLDAVKNGFTHFISGGALGFDTIATELIITLKKRKKLTLEIAVPCPEQNIMWSLQQKQRYMNLLKKADKQTLICKTYVPRCFQIRNQYMVDNSSLIIAFFDGSPSGTKNTVEYANAKGKKIAILNPFDN